MFRADSRPRTGEAALTLPELLISLSLGVLLAGLALQALLTEVRNSSRLGIRQQERRMAERALALIRGDVLRAESFSLDGTVASACGLSGGAVLLHLVNAAGLEPTTYTFGMPPSPIWRGQVLMRCGPTFNANGELRAGPARNSVVLDGLVADGATVAEIRGGLEVRLEGEEVYRVVMPKPAL